MAAGRTALPGPARPGRVRATKFAQRDLVVNGLRLRYVDEPPRAAGANVPVAVVIPGHTSRIEGYDGLVPWISGSHRTLVLDFPGSGYSEKPDRAYDLAFYEDTLIAFLDALGVGRARLVGGSLGGNLVLRLGHRLPERFDRLVAWAPGSAWKARPRLAAFVRAVAGRRLFWPTVFVQSRYWYRPDWPGREAALADTFAYYREVFGPGFVRMYFGIAADSLARSLFDLAPAIRSPVLLVCGELDDGANMAAGVRRLDALLPRRELRWIPNARHSLASEVPDVLGAMIDEFLRRPEALLP